MTPDAKSKSAYKIDYLRDYLKSYKGYIPIICITESWIKSYVSKAQISIPSYNVYRSDREERIRGGCLTYIHQDISVGEVSFFDNMFCEVCITPLDKVQTAVITVYRPPKCPLSKFRQLIDFVQNFINHVGDSWTFLISGDLNFPNIEWPTLSVNAGLTTEENNSAKVLLNFLDINGMAQFIDIPTRSVDDAENILDVLISNSSELVLDTKAEETMLSDHDWVTISLGSDLAPLKIKDTVKKRPFNFSCMNFSKADFGKINSYILNNDWNSIFEESPNDFAQRFMDIIFRICQLCVPIKGLLANGSTNATKVSKKQKGISGLKRKRKIIRSRLRALELHNPLSERIPFLKSSLDNVNSSIKSRLSLHRLKEEQKAVAAIKRNPTFFYNFVKKSAKVKCKIGPLKDKFGQYVSDSEQMANLLQKQYCSVFSDPNSVKKEDPTFSSAQTSLEDIQFFVEDIAHAIDKLRINAAPGEDEVPVILLKNCRDSISLPLFLLWKHSFESGTINQSYRSQLIAPIFKGGSKLDPANYRPVSLTSHIIKIFERVLQSKIVQYLEENNLLSKSQHGFRKGCSCLSELLAHFNHLYENLGSCHDTDTIYLDFSKAFDKVDHALLIKKLQLYGIKGKLLRWIKSFLSNRIQKVVVNGKVSVVELVISGVPQGTVLGPLLFLLFVNDIELYIENSHLKLFADDSRLFKKIHPSSSPDGSECLQNDLDNVCRWATANNMVLNETKFQLLSHHVHSHAPNNNMRMLQQLPFAEAQYIRQYTLPNNAILEGSSYLTDLGIVVSNDFSFEWHINQIAKKANMKCSWILSVFRTRDSYSMLTLFRSLVLSILEYSCPLWSPYRIQDIAKLEAVQRRFTSKFDSIKHLDYWDRLKSLKLMSLQRRRERYILIYAWKILNKKVPNDVGMVWQDNARKGKVAVIPNLPSSVTKINTSFDRFFKVNAGRLWNCIPKTVNKVTSLEGFKSKLDSYLMNIPDCPPVAGYATINTNSIIDWFYSSNSY